MPIPSLRQVLVTLVLVLIPSRAFAWIDTGHKMIAMIAWEEMTPKTRTAVTEVLKQHPRYEKDLLIGAPENATPDQLAQHAFAVAATWPDMVRSRSHPMTNQFNHPLWHYIDIPFEDGAKAPPPSNQGPGPHNVVEALIACREDLADATMPADKHAIDICWIEHSVSDIHQPLHATTRFTPDLPKGDAGGNNSIVLRDPPYADSKAKLHLVWDQMPGDYKAEFVMQYVATGVRNDPQFSRESLKSILASTDVKAWADESHALGVEYVYLNGKLEAAVSKGGNAPTTQAIPGLPPGYLEQGEKIALQRVALAGYRLADLFNAMYDPKPGQ